MPRAMGPNMGSLGHFWCARKKLHQSWFPAITWFVCLANCCCWRFSASTMIQGNGWTPGTSCCSSRARTTPPSGCWPGPGPTSRNPVLAEGARRAGRYGHQGRAARGRGVSWEIVVVGIPRPRDRDTAADATCFGPDEWEHVDPRGHRRGLRIFENTRNGVPTLNVAPGAILKLFSSTNSGLHSQRSREASDGLDCTSHPAHGLGNYPDMTPLPLWKGRVETGTAGRDGQCSLLPVPMTASVSRSSRSEPPVKTDRIRGHPNFNM